LHCNRKWSTV